MKIRLLCELELNLLFMQLLRDSSYVCYFDRYNILLQRGQFFVKKMPSNFSKNIVDIATKISKKNNFEILKELGKILKKA